MTSNNTADMVVLVDAGDNTLGTMEKMEAHRKGVLHRAVSILVFNNRKEWLLHRRAREKYHAGGLWTNACCTHPFLEESYEDAACRRMMEEMGIEVEAKRLVRLFDFTYTALFDNGLTEHEYDRVFAYITDTEPVPNPDEVMDWKYSSQETLDSDIRNNPDLYTPWFRIIYQKAMEHSDKIEGCFGRG